MPEHTNQSGDNDPPEVWPPKFHVNEFPLPQTVWEAIGPFPFGLIAHEKFGIPAPNYTGALKIWSLIWQSRHNVAAGPPAGGPIIREP